MFNLINKCYNNIYNNIYNKPSNSNSNNYNNFRYNTVSQIRKKPYLTIDTQFANSYNKEIALLNKSKTFNYVTDLNVVAMDTELILDIDTEVDKNLKEIYKRFIKKHCIGLFIICFGFLAYSHSRKNNNML
jgi:hypothetical protein